MTSAIEASSDSCRESETIGWTSTLQKLGRVVAARAGEEAVDDVLQEVALAATRSSKMPRQEPDRGRFLVAIALRQAALWLRRKYRDADVLEPASSKTADLMETAPAGRRTTEDPVFFLMAVESAETTRTCLARLEPAERELLIQKYVQRVSYQGIADRYGWSRHVAEYRVRLAKSKLRGLMLDVGLGTDT
ncbi:MAG: sigma-70 family RNA polymerase sigma factor [Planctomycetota bacterium]